MLQRGLTTIIFFSQVKNPQRDLPLGIGLALLICGGLYILVSAVIVGLVPYNMIDPDTPMSTVFLENGMPWAMYNPTTPKPQSFYLAVGFKVFLEP
jgi:amino acid transporter